MNTAAADGQAELFPAWRYHAVFTDTPFETIQAEEHHRDHAVTSAGLECLTVCVRQLGGRRP